MNRHCSNGRLKSSCTAWILIPLLIWIGFFGTANALTIPLREIEILSPKDIGTQVRTALPHFIEQNKSALLSVNWQIRLPDELSQQELPTLLLPQPIQGARFSLHGEVIYELPRSTAAQLHNWYTPILIQIPRHLLRNAQGNVLLVEQVGHLRGWFIAPMLAGDLNSLRRLFDTYSFISQTLSTTINLLCGVMGLFLIIMGLRTRQKNYLFSGLSVLTWSILFTLALLPSIRTEYWFMWRTSVYLLTGWLIYFVIRFMFSIFGKHHSRAIHVVALVLINSGWVLFLVWGQDAESALDSLWTGLVVGIYIAASGWVIVPMLLKKDWKKVVPIGLHWVITSCFAAHDYALQSGLLPLVIPTQPVGLWTHFLFQPIYLTHLALPAFVAMAMWLLAKDLAQKTNSERLHQQQLHEQRENMVANIHDGVGSRINLLLWRMRSETPERHLIESELERCMDELRFAINPRQSGHASLHKALQLLCERQKTACAAAGIQLQYLHSNEDMTAMSCHIALHLYKATQECLSNSLRHSHANHIQIRLNCTPQKIQIDVEDNGCGIPHWDNAAQSQTQRCDTALGLNSLRRRMKNQGGDCQIHSSHKGTTVHLTLPPRSTN